jgi:hypothetical protein
MYLIIIILILTIIHIKFGLLVLISIIVWSIIFLLSNFLLGLNPNNKEMFIIRIISILVIIFILYYNSLEYGIITSLIIPLSINKITYLEDILNEKENYHLNIFFLRKPNLLWLSFSDYKEIMNLLCLLDHNKAYIVTFDLILDQSGYQLGDPSIILGSPILISKDSNPWLISKYLSSKVVKSCNSYDLNDQTEVSILVKYREIIVFED